VRLNEHQGGAVVPTRLQDGLESLETHRIALQVGQITGMAEFKNPQAPAVKREAEEWSKENRR
jgi:hypothetical protein